MVCPRAYAKAAAMAVWLCAGVAPGFARARDDTPRSARTPGRVEPASLRSVPAPARAADDASRATGAQAAAREAPPRRFPVTAPAVYVVGDVPERVERVLRSRLPRKWWRGEAALRRAMDVVLETMHEFGYPDARARFEQTSEGWSLSVRAGPRAVLVAANVRAPAGVDTTAARDALGLVEGAPWSPAEFARRARELVERYDEAGHPYAAVWVDAAHYDRKRKGVTLRVTVTEGPAGPVRSVRFEGLARTRPEFARRLSGLVPGRPYSWVALERARRRLQESGVFDRVDEPRVLRAVDGRGFDVVVPLHEPRRANRLSAALGYASAEGAGDRRTVSGQAHLELVNIAGALRDAEVFWSNDGRGRRETRLRYADRFVAGRSLGAAMVLEQIGEDTTYTWQSARVDLSAPLAHGGALRVDALVRAAADRNVFGTGELVRTWRWRGGLGVRAERIGRRSLVRAESRIDAARKRETFRGDSTGTRTQWIVSFDGELERSLLRALRVRLRPRYRGLESDEAELPVSEQFAVGGARTLRGFRENRFRARRAATLASELVVGPRRDEALYVFVDAAWLDTRVPALGGVERRTLTPVGFGFGFRTAAAGGTIDLAFGVGDRLSLRQTKVHVILEQRF